MRARFPGSGRYWEKDLEIDMVAIDPEDSTGLVVAEVNWRQIGAGERRRILDELERKWHRSALKPHHPKVRFLVLEATDALPQSRYSNPP